MGQKVQRKGFLKCLHFDKKKQEKVLFSTGKSWGFIQSLDLHRNPILLDIEWQVLKKKKSKPVSFQTYSNLIITVKCICNFLSVLQSALVHSIMCWGSYVKSLRQLHSQKDRWRTLYLPMKSSFLPASLSQSVMSTKPPCSSYRWKSNCSLHWGFSVFGIVWVNNRRKYSHISI